MFIDDYGKEFKTREEAKQYYADEFKNTVLKDDYEELANYLDFDVIVLEWIFQDCSELLPKFYKKFSSELKDAERDYIDNALCNLEEV